MSSQLNLWLLAALAAVILSANLCAGIRLDYDAYDMIDMKKTKEINLRLSFNEVLGEDAQWPRNQKIILTFALWDEESWAIDMYNQSLTFTYDQIRRRTKQAITLGGAIVGFNDLEVYAHITNSSKPPAMITIDGEQKEEWYQLPALDKDGKPYQSKQDLIAEAEANDEKVDEEAILDPSKYDPYHMTPRADARVQIRKMQVKVAVSDKTLNNIFTMVVTLMIIVNTVNMGGQLDLEIIKGVFRKPVGPMVGFASQFVLMPVFAYLVGWLLSDDILFRLGLFVLGCCPGGSGSNFWCILLGGDINLSITMTFISTIAALGMMPFWLWALGRFLTKGAFVIPFGRLLMSLVFLIAPIALGMWIRYRFDKAAPVMTKIIVPFTLLTVFFIFTVGVYVNLFIFQLIDFQMVLAGFLVAGAGYLFGATLAWLCRLSLPQIKAVSIETAFQNGGIAFILLKVSLPPPYGDLATVAPVAQLVITGTPLWIMLGIYKIYVKCCRRQQPVVEPLQQEDTKDGDLMAEEGKDPLTKYALAPTWSADSKTTDII